MKNHFTLLRFNRLFYAVFLFFASPAWATIASDKTDSATIEFQPEFWHKIVRSAPVGALRDWKNLNRRAEAYFHHLELLINSQIFQDHFSVRLESLVEEKKGFRDLETISLIQKIWKILKSGSYDKIRELLKLIKENPFSKTDKMLMAVVLILHNDLSSKELFDVIESLELSVNDQLKIEDLHLSSPTWLMKTSTREPSFLEERNGTLAILSHFLASTGDPEIIEKLFLLGYDSSIKTSIGDNILHSFSQINRLRASIQNSRSAEDHEKAVHLLAEHSPQLMEETNILRITPLTSAYMMNVRPAIQALRTKKPSTNRATYTDPLTYLNDKSSSNFRNQLSKKADADFENQQIAYLDFEPLISNLISSIHFSNPMQERVFYSVQDQLIYFEAVRLEMLLHLLYDNTSSNTGEAAQKRMLLQTMFWKNNGMGKKVDLSAWEEDLLKMRFTFTSDGNEMLLSNTFLEAIRHSSLPWVQALLEHYTISDLMGTGLPFVGLDPLSLSLIVYAGLPEEHPRKNQAKEIVRTLAKKVNLNILPPGIISLPPIVWGTLLGLLDEVQFLKSQEAVVISELIHQEQWKINLIDYARQKGFIKLGDWLEGQTQKKSDKCKRNYLQ